MNEAIHTIKVANNGIEAVTVLIQSARSLANSAMAIDACSTPRSQNAIDRATLASQFDMDWIWITITLNHIWQFVSVYDNTLHERYIPILSDSCR
jgi:hypothetical protein